MVKQTNFAFISPLLSNSPELRQVDSTVIEQAPKIGHQTNSLEYIWSNLIRDFFSDRLDLLDYRLGWSSRRQKRTLASCNLRARRVLVAQELNHPDYQQFLPALIYHELCHAVLGYSVRSTSGKSRWHGREFKKLECRHPEIDLLNQWIKAGGWRQAIRRHRGKIASKARAKKTKPMPRSLLSRLFRNLLLK